MFKTSKSDALTLLGLMLFLSIGAQAQTCKLRWTQEQSCLNVAELSGKTVVVPSNVTRLGQDGLSLCPLESSHSEVPAVIFIMDQSASMDSAFAGVPAGDPIHWRGSLVQNAIRYLNEKSAGTGWFSYIEFAGNVEVSVQPPHADCVDGVNDGATKLLSQDFLTLSDSIVNIWGSKTGPVQNRCNTGTNYFSVLDRAKKYASTFDPGDVNAEVSVIFVSDGRPNKSTDKTFEPLDTNYTIPGKFPPVHGIFLGTSDGETLAQLSDSTGGTYTMVNPGDTAAMNSVMNGIIELISRVSNPSKVTLNVNGLAYPANQVKTASGGYQVTFPNDIPLVPGENVLEMTVSYVDGTGAARNSITRFTIMAEGPAAGVGTVKVDSVFAAYCAIGNSILINDIEDPQLTVGASLKQTPHLSLLDGSSLDVVLTAAGYSGDVTNLRVMSKRTGDVILAPLSSQDVAGKFGATISMVAVKGTRTGALSPVDTTDATFNVAAFDTLLFYWQNPEDIRDTLTASILLYEVPRIFFDSDSLFINQIGSLVTDDAAMGARVSVEYSWLDGSYISTNTLGRTDITSKFHSVADLESVLLDRVSERIIVTYIDPVYNTEYKDTATLIFDSPVVPVAWLLDENGDGQADMLQLTYLEPRSSKQYTPSFQLIWGAQNQDTLFLRVDSLNPKLSFDVVQIQQNAVGEQWRFALKTPLPFGHTSGSGELGEGILIIQAAFNGRNVKLEIPVVDKIGPVVMEMWTDTKAIDVVYFRASEPVTPGENKDWLYSKRGNSLESVKNTLSYEQSGDNGVYSLRLIDRDNNRIFAGDSARFIPGSLGGVRDRNGNGATEENPFVEVKGTRPANNSILVAFKQNVVKDNVKVEMPPTDKDVEKEFRTLVLDPETGKYVELGTNKPIDPRFSDAMPALGLTISLPQVHGFDSKGAPLEGSLVDGLLAWETTVKGSAMFYDQQGQFIARRTASVVLDDPSKVSREGTVNVALVWQVDQTKGLVAYSGRSVGSGVLLAKVKIDMVSTATMDLKVYDQEGEIVKSQSVKKGDELKKKKEFLSRLGYMRK